MPQPQPLTAQEEAAWEAAQRHPFASAPVPSPVSRPAAQGLSPDEERAWANVRPMGWGEDALRSYATGLERTGANFAANPRRQADVAPTALDAAGSDTDAIASLIRAGVTGKGDVQLPGWAKGVNFDPSQPLSQWGQQFQHMIGSTDNPVGHALATVTSPFASMGHYGPTQDQADQAMQQVGQLYHDPQTWQGRTAELGGDLTLAAALPGKAGTRLMRVAVPTGAGAAAGEVAHGTPYERDVRLLGVMLGGGLQGFGEGVAAAPQRILNESAGALTPAQIDQAATLRNAGAQAGVDLTIPEAVSQVTNGATGLPRLQRLVENTGRTAPVMRDYFAQRPGQVRGAVQGFADQVSPDTGSPGVLGLDANRAGQGAQIAANNARLDASRPFYRAADGQDVDRQAMADILERIDGQIAGDKTGLIAPTLGQLRTSLTEAPASAGTPPTRTPTQAPAGTIYHFDPGEPGSPREPITNIGNLSTARNHWRDVIDLPPVGPNALTKYQAGIIGDHLDDLDRLLKANPDRVLGDQQYAAMSRGLVDPLNAGPVGRIAGTESVPEQTAALYPANPPLGQPGDTAGAMSALGSQNETIPAALTRQHLMNTFNQSTRDLTSGPNQYGGARYARDLMGNDEQAATLHAGLGAIDPTGGLSSNLDDLADILQATGRRERPGSLTAFNTDDLNALKLAPQAVRFLGGLGDPLEWTKNLSNVTGGMLYRRHLDSLADLLTNPDTAGVLSRAQQARAGGDIPLQLLAPSLAQGSNP